jgi:hypothetical protein
LSYRIIWNYPALRVFYNLPRHSATLLDRTVIRFAERGEGEIEWDPPHYRLRAGIHDAMLAIDEAARIVYVVRVYRAAR